MNTTRIKLTASQLSAVEIYVTDPVHEEHEGIFSLVGRQLEIVGDLTAAGMLLIDAANSADDDGPDSGVVALGNLASKVMRRGASA
jgi:hypothetical protein